MACRDRALKRVFDEHGYQDMWARRPGFSSTVHIILGQQVSIASANATFNRLKCKLGSTVTPEGLLNLKESELNNLGYTRQKSPYAQLLAERVASGDFLFDSLTPLADDVNRSVITKHKGIGNRTADIYLSECLLRCDVLPKGDIGVQEALRVLNGLESRPTHDELDAMTEDWRPWRSVGTRMLWQIYLDG